jgi:hypothetical protein
MKTACRDSFKNHREWDDRLCRVSVWMAALVGDPTPPQLARSRFDLVALASEIHGTTDTIHGSKERFMYRPSGMTYATRAISGKPFRHHAVFDWDNPLGLVRVGVPVVIELLPIGPHARPFVAGEAWQGTPVSDLGSARQRLWLLLQSPEKHRYHALFNNCEHFARFVAFGEFRSEQVRGIVTVGLLLWGARALFGRASRRAA